MAAPTTPVLKKVDGWLSSKLDTALEVAAGAAKSSKRARAMKTDEIQTEDLARSGGAPDEE